MVAVGKFSMKQVQDAWRGRSALRGYHFGFNLKTLRPDEASLRDWFVEAQKAGVTGRKDIEATAYVTPLHAYVARNAAEFRVARGIQEIHWASPGSHTSEPETYDLSQDYFRFMFAPDVEPTNNHSEQQIRHCVIDRKITQGT
ncbi:MAG TPA: transposase, partial [Pirellulaceae bacterium]|nr:transposase [Pirellulaceae bacterium]